MTLQLPRVLALAPSGVSDSGLVVAGSRAGALGVLDFGITFDAEPACEAVRRVAGRHRLAECSGGFGGRIRTSDRDRSRLWVNRPRPS